MIKIDYNDVIGVHSGCIEYINSDGIKGSINLEEARKSQFERINSAEEYSDVFGANFEYADLTECTLAGSMVLCGKVPYYEFTTDDETFRIEFLYSPSFLDFLFSNRKNRYFEKFLSLQKELEKLGYTLYEP